MKFSVKKPCKHALSFSTDAEVLDDFFIGHTWEALRGGPCCSLDTEHSTLSTWKLNSHEFHPCPGQERCNSRVYLSISSLECPESFSFVILGVLCLLLCLFSLRNKVAACAKHFVGDGGTTKGINENNTVIDYNGLLSIHMPAYLDAIRKGVATVMVSYSSWNGKKMHANGDLVTGFWKTS